MSKVFASNCLGPSQANVEHASEEAQGKLSVPRHACTVLLVLLQSLPQSHMLFLH